MSDFNPLTITLLPELKGRLFFTVKEFGSLVGKSREAIFRWARLGYIKLIKFSPRNSMVSIKELERFMRGEMME
jgi:hypothetical protein